MASIKEYQDKVSQYNQEKTRLELEIENVESQMKSSLAELKAMGFTTVKEASESLLQSRAKLDASCAEIEELLVKIKNFNYKAEAQLEVKQEPKKQAAIENISSGFDDLDKLFEI